MKFLSVMLVLTMVLSSQEVWAKRIGGGGSFGKQSSNVMQRNTPAQPAQAPTQNNATQNANTANRPAQPAAAQQASRPWGAMLGGLAAGLGLAWLASSLGFGEGFGQFLLILLLAVAGFALFRMLRRPAAHMQSPMSFQGNGSATMPGSMPSYSPQNVGNDASARPWESAAGNTSGGSLIGAALRGSQTWGIPQGFDVDGFLAASKKNFVTLQSAWDRGDIAALRTMMTDDMLAEIKGQLAEREQHAGAPNVTEVITLDAQLLGIEETEHEYMASVEFSGMISEDAFAGPTAFREVWNITKPKAGGGWLVAGLQALQ